MNKIIGENGQPTLVMLTIDEAWEKKKQEQSKLFRSKQDVKDFYDRGDAPYAEWTWRYATQEDVNESNRPVLNPPKDWNWSNFGIGVTSLR